MGLLIVFLAGDGLLTLSFFVDAVVIPWADKGLRLPKQSANTTVNNRCRHLWLYECSRSDKFQRISAKSLP